MLQKPNISKPKKTTKRNLKSKTPPEVSKLLNTIGLDSSSSFSSRSSSSSKNKSGFSSESSNSNSGNQAKGSSQNVTCISSSYNESLQMSPIDKTKSDKRIRKNYKFIRTFESLTEMDTYVRSSTKGTLHFHDFIHISKTYPLQSLKKKKFLKMVAVTKYWVFRYSKELLNI